MLRTPHAPTRVLLAALALGAATTAALAAADESAAEAWTREALESARLRGQAELAAGKDFYLVLDADASELRLMLQGVVLREFPIARLDLGVPERAFVRPSPPADLRGHVWASGALDPPHAREREELKIPDPNTPDEELEPPIPPPPPPAPDRYFIRYGNGLSLEVRRSDGAIGSTTGGVRGLLDAVRRKLIDVGAALGGDGRPRLRVFLRGEDVDSLYRALPPETELIVL